MIQPKFEIGQKVFCARIGYGSVKVQCPDCLGQKKWLVKTPSGEEWDHDCNTCRQGYYGSSGTVESWGDHERIEMLTIGSIRIDTQDKERPISYMCEETGIRSGSVYNEQEMFSDRSDAESWCAAELPKVAALRRDEEAKRLNYKKKDSIYKPTKAKK